MLRVAEDVGYWKVNPYSQHLRDWTAAVDDQVSFWQHAHASIVLCDRCGVLMCCASADALSRSGTRPGGWLQEQLNPEMRSMSAPDANLQPPAW